MLIGSKVHQSVHSWASFKQLAESRCSSRSVILLKVIKQREKESNSQHTNLSRDRLWKIKSHDPPKWTILTRNCCVVSHDKCDCGTRHHNETETRTSALFPALCMWAPLVCRSSLNKVGLSEWSPLCDQKQRNADRRLASSLTGISSDYENVGRI